MKNSNFIKNSIIALLPISLGLGVLFGVQKTESVETKAYNYTTLSKMDIDLNDTGDQEIRDYYADLLSKSSSERQGTNLLKNLKPILKDGQTYFSYDNGKESIWRLYEITDRDWEKSGPTFGNNGTYNASTNIISNYQFGAGKSNDSKNPYVHALYMDRTIDNPVKAYGNHNQDGTGINQEHIWAKSHGFDTAPTTEASGGARGDPMHLWAANGYANNIHSNYYFGYVDKDGSGVVDTSVLYSTVAANYRGQSLTLGSGTVFEPQDSDKGDIARAIFYMAARYNNYEGASSGFNGNEPNLFLDSTPNTTTGTSTASNPFSMGVLSDLLEWNKIDPPDEYEIHRNNLLFTNFTHNRNPFIDFPDWADIAFGSSSKYADPLHDSINGTSSEKQLLSISVTTQPSKTSYVEDEYFDPTGMVVKANYDDGTSVTVTGYTWSPNGQLTTSNKTITISYDGKTATVNITVNSSVIHPNSITISPSSFELEEGSSRRLTATVLPSNATEQGVNWSSSDSSVATVSSTGYVTAVGPGNATITATSKDTYTTILGTCSVTVPQPIVFDRIVLSGTYKTTFNVGDVFTNTGIVVTAKYKQGGVDVPSLDEDVTLETEFSGFDSSEAGPCTITASYNGKTASYTVTINAVPVTEDTVVFDSTSYGFSNAQTVDQIIQGNFAVGFFGSGTQAAYYDNGASIRVYHDSSFTISGNKKIVEISFTYGSYDKIGDNRWSTDVGTVDGTTGTWSLSGGADSVTFTLSGSTTGHRRISTIIVKYDPSQDAVVSLQSISVSGNQKTKFYQYDTFTYEGLIVTAHYSDLSSNIVLPTSVTGYDMSKTGYQSIIVSFTDDGITKTAKYSIQIIALYATGIELSGEYQTTFTKNETFNYDNLVVTALLNNGGTTDVTSEATVDAVDTSTLGSQIVSVHYNDLSATYNIEVVKDPAAPITVDINIKTYASEHSWANGTKYSTIEMDSVVTAQISDETNSGKYYTAGYEWRMYQTENPSLTISVADSYKLESVAITYNVTNTGTLLYKEAEVSSLESVSSGCKEMVFYLGNTATATTGQVKITDLSVTYKLATAYERVPEKIELSGNYKTSFYVGDAFSSDNLIVTAHYNSGLIEEVMPTNITGYNMTNPSNQEVTVSYSENGVTKTAKYTITVIDVIPEEIVLSGTYKTSYFVGQELDTNGLIVTCNYDNETSKDVTNGVEITGYNKTKVGEQTITVTYTEKGIPLSATYKVNVIAIKPVSLQIKTNPTKLTYFEGDTFDPSGIAVIINYNNESSIELVADDLTFSDYDMSVVGSQSVKVSYTEEGNTVSNTFNIQVNKVEFESLTLSGLYKTSFLYDTDFSHDGLVATLKYNNGVQEDVSNYVTFSGYNMKQIGTQTITVLYEKAGEKITTSYEIEVNKITPVSLTLSGSYKTTFEFGEAFTYSGLVATAKYDNDKSYEVTPTSVTGYNTSKSGEQTITVSYTENGSTVTATYKITVLEEPVYLSFITLSGNYKTEFWEGEEFNSDNLVVTAHYSDGSSKEVAPTSISGYNKTTCGEQTITVTYCEDDKQVSTTYVVTVTKILVTKIELSGNYQTEFEYGSSFSSQGLVVTAHYNNGTSTIVNPSSVIGYNGTKVGEQTITVSYSENGVTVTATYKITLKEKVVPTPTPEPEPTPTPETNTINPIAIAAVGGGVVVITGSVIGISVGVSKKHKRKGK